MYFCEVGKFIDELNWMNIEVFSSAFLADESPRAFRITAHVLARFLMSLALGIYHLHSTNITTIIICYHMA